MLQSSRCAEEGAELHHERSTRVFNSEFYRRQIECIVCQAARTRSSLLRTRCRLRGIVFPIIWNNSVISSRNSLFNINLNSKIDSIYINKFVIDSLKLCCTYAYFSIILNNLHYNLQFNFNSKIGDLKIPIINFNKKFFDKLKTDFSFAKKSRRGAHNSYKL